jgi:hypothetical protein
VSIASIGAGVLVGSWLLGGLSVVLVGLSVVVKREILGRQWHQQTADPYLWQSIPCE